MRRLNDPTFTHMAMRNQRAVERAHSRQSQPWRSPLTRMGEGAVGGVIFFVYLGWLFFF